MFLYYWILFWDPRINDRATSPCWWHLARIAYVRNSRITTGARIRSVIVAGHIHSEITTGCILCCGQAWVQMYSVVASSFTGNLSLCGLDSVHLILTKIPWGVLQMLSQISRSESLRARRSLAILPCVVASGIIKNLLPGSHTNHGAWGRSLQSLTN